MEEIHGCSKEEGSGCARDVTIPRDAYIVYIVLKTHPF
jgi:hypothetical protein